MKGTFSTTSYSPAAFAIFSFASLKVESLRAIRSSLDCMPQLIHLRRQEKTFVPNGTARTNHLMSHPEQSASRSVGHQLPVSRFIRTLMLLIDVSRCARTRRVFYVQEAEADGTTRLEVERMESGVYATEAPGF